MTGKRNWAPIPLDGEGAGGGGGLAVGGYKWGPVFTFGQMYAGGGGATLRQTETCNRYVGEIEGLLSADHWWGHLGRRRQEPVHRERGAWGAPRFGQR